MLQFSSCAVIVYGIGDGSLGSGLNRQMETAAIRLQSMATRLLRLARSANEKHGLGSAQYSAMAVLYDRGPLSVLELARFERVAHPTMSRIVTSLEKAGTVERIAVPQDRRTRHVQLTPQGRSLYEKVCANRVAVTAAILSQLKSETIAELLEAVERVSTMLEKRPPEN